MIRELVEQDAMMLLSLSRQLTETNSSIGVVEDLLREAYKSKSHYIFGYFLNTGLIATVSLTKCIDFTGNGNHYFHMENFVVDNEYQGQGYGQLLLEFCELFVRENNGRSLQFVSSQSRINAHKFYEKHGYKDYPVQGYKKYFD